MLGNGEEEMIRFLTFFAVVVGLVMYFYYTTRPRSVRGTGPKNLQRRPSKQALYDFNEFWIQVYDTDSADEALKIQVKFHDMNIQCFLYEQGKKDVYGNIPKHYGISVPRKSFEKAQSALAQINF